MSDLSTDGMQIVVGEFQTAAAVIRPIALSLYERMDVGDPQLDDLRPVFEEWSGLQFDRIISYVSEFEEATTAACVTFRTIAGSEWEHRPEISFFRRAIMGQRSAVSWHCDAEAASTRKFGKDCVTMWMPLEPVGAGSGSPSLELVIGSHRAMCGRDDLSTQHREDKFVAAIDGAHVTPILDLGDVILFDHFVLHRTEQVRTQKPRLSAEFRFIR